MNDFVEFYAACDPLLIPQAVQEIIDHTRRQFGQVMHELLYEPDAHWFRCLTTRANKERIYQFLVQLMCRVAREEMSFTADIVFEGMPFFNARTIAWNDYCNCREVQFKFDDEYIYPMAFASFPHRGVWENFGNCRLQTLFRLLNEFSCFFGHKPLQQFSLVTRCTISHNLRGDVVFLMSHDGMQNIQNGRRALESLVDACNMGVQMAQDKTSIYCHLIALSNAEHVSFRFTKLQDLGIFNRTCDVRADAKRASVLRTVYLTGKDQNVGVEEAYADVLGQTSECYYHEIMGCRLLPKEADIPGIFLHQPRLPQLSLVESTTFSHRVDAWRNNVTAQSHSSVGDIETRSSAAPMSDNNDDLIDLFNTVSEKQGFEKGNKTADGYDMKSNAAATTTDWLSDDPLITGPNMHLRPVTSLSSPQSAGEMQLVDHPIRNVGKRAASIAKNLKLLIKTLLIAPTASTLKLEIGRIYFASQPSREADSFFSRSVIENMLKETMGLPPISNYSSLVSTNLLDLPKVTQIQPSPNVEWHTSGNKVYYRISCTAYGEKPFVIHINAKTLEFHCSMPEIPCVNAYIHCPRNAWDLSIKGFRRNPTYGDLCEMAQKAVSSMKIGHNSRGNPTIEVMDLTRLGGMINDITIRYSSTLRCISSPDISMDMSWNQSLKRQKGLIRHEPSESAGNTWLWQVVAPPQLSRHWLTISFASDSVNNMLQKIPHTVLHESNARLDQLESGGVLGSLCHLAIRMVSQLDAINPDPEQIEKLQKQSDSHAGQKRSVGSYEQNEDEEEFW